MAEWAAFERFYGPLLVGDRVDLSGAQSAFIAARAAGARNAQFRDFVPDWGGVRAAEEQEGLLGKLIAFRDSHVSKE